MNTRLSVRLGTLLLSIGLLASCRTCPIVACHTRKVHTHNGVRYRGQPLWKKQNPAIGEKIKVNEQRETRHKSDKSKPKI